MNNVYQLKFTENNESKYFNELSKETQQIVKDAILKAADDRSGPEGYKSNDDALSSIECKSRDGFIPFSHNKGGILYRNFTTLNDYFGGGYIVKHKGARKEIERQIDFSLQSASEAFFAHHGHKIVKYKMTVENTNYHSLLKLEEKHPNDKDLKSISETFSEYERSNMDGDDSSIMHEIRFMFHGVNDEGKFSASVSCAVNTEGPYHRSSISWASGVFCEGAKEIEIEWRTDKQLIKELETALKLCSKEIF